VIADSHHLFDFSFSKFYDQTTTMPSTDGPEAEFNNPRRKELLKALKGALLADTIQPTAWACLWLSDIDRLEHLVSLTQESPVVANLALEAVEPLVRIVPTCKLLAFILSDY
jgi:hypothetical protein